MIVFNEIFIKVYLIIRLEIFFPYILKYLHYYNISHLTKVKLEVDDLCVV